jgi:hypothetical protein
VDVENDINVSVKKKFLTVYCGSGEKVKIIIDGQDVNSVYELYWYNDISNFVEKLPVSPH